MLSPTIQTIQLGEFTERLLEIDNRSSISRHIKVNNTENQRAWVLSLNYKSSANLHERLHKGIKHCEVFFNGFQ